VSDDITLHRYDRQHEGIDQSLTEPRRAFERDRDRILYSYQFRRLAGVTQVASVAETHLLHNRLTHSLKVAQIARSIAKGLEHSSAPLLEHVEGGSVDCDVAEAAGLAHDLGHPPFGHIAEWELNSQAQQYGGFEGNAQTFRIVTKLATRKAHFNGLDLTYATLNGILKYPTKRLSAGDVTDAVTASAPDSYLWTDRYHISKQGVYGSESEVFDLVRKHSSGDGRRSAEAIIMDWADDVSYAVHDVEDFFRAGQIPLNSLAAHQDALMKAAVKRLTALDARGAPHKEKLDTDLLKKALDRIMKACRGFQRPYLGEREDDWALYRFANDRFQEFVTDIKLSAEAPYVVLRDELQYKVLMLMELTWYFVINRPALGAAQEGQRRLIGDLYQILTNWVSAKNQGKRSQAPARLLDLIARSRQDPNDVSHAKLLSDESSAVRSDDYHLARGVVDFISGLTEPQTVELYARLTGRSGQQFLGATWL